MNTKHPAPWLSWIFYVQGILLFIAALCLLVIYIILYADNSRAEHELLGIAVGLVALGWTYLAIGMAIHQVLDFLYRSAEANEAMQELLKRQIRVLAARENAPAVQPPVAKFYTITEPDTPPVKQAADELKSTCGHCSTQILFPREGVGQKVPCPACGNAVLLAAN